MIIHSNGVQIPVNRENMVLLLAARDFVYFSKVTLTFETYHGVSPSMIEAFLREANRT